MKCSVCGKETKYLFNIYFALKDNICLECYYWSVRYISSLPYINQIPLLKQLEME